LSTTTLPHLIHDLRCEPVPVTLERIAVQDHDVRQLACFECSQLIAHLDVGRGVRPHDLHEILHREHDVERLQLVLEAGFRVVGRIGAVTEDHAGVEQRACVHRHIPGLLAKANAVDD